ncbi:hypothetical protein OROHE_003182 [Orobanche hederae]
MKIPAALATGFEEMETDNPNLEKVETDNGDNMLDILEYDYTEEMEAYMEEMMEQINAESIVVLEKVLFVEDGAKDASNENDGAGGD